RAARVFPSPVVPRAIPTRAAGLPLPAADQRSSPALIGPNYGERGAPSLKTRDSIHDGGALSQHPGKGPLRLRRLALIVWFDLVPRAILPIITSLNSGQRKNLRTIAMRIRIVARQLLHPLARP